MAYVTRPECTVFSIQIKVFTYMKTYALGIWRVSDSLCIVTHAKVQVGIPVVNFTVILSFGIARSASWIILSQKCSLTLLGM